MFTSWTSTLPITRARCHQFWAAITVNIGIMICREYYGWPSSTIPKLTQPNAPLCLHHLDITWMVSIQSQHWNHDRRRVLRLAFPHNPQANSAQRPFMSPPLRD
ncbi:hypothetical protein J6590_011948 [Homalodisca vitripennis]|nr:hypothetical protein J6590_011948 [Homalodisca vitripennis]